MKHVLIQILRHLTQLAVIGLVFLLVYLSLYAHYRSARAMEDPQFFRGFHGMVLKAIDGQVRDFKDPQSFLDGYKGTLWSMRVGGIEWTDPLAAAEMTVTSRTFHAPFLWSILIPVVLAVVLGRVFCSWICPAGLLFALTDKVRILLGWVELKPASVVFSHRNKYVVLVVGLLVSCALGLPLFAMIYPPAVMSRIAHGLVYGSVISSMVMILLAMVLVEVFVSPRWWCRTVCPGGALYGLLGVKRLLRIRLDTKACTGCKDCIPPCPMGLNPITESASIECDNCGVCLQQCSDGALYYQVGLPLKKKKVNSTVVVTVVMGLLFCFPTQTFAHHILGLPHYAYRENYPQVPTLEYPATSGPYEILMTTYPGRPMPGDTVNVTFYIKNGKTEQPYETPVNVKVSQKLAFGRRKVILENTTVEPFDRTHKVTVKFPSSGEFIIQLTMDVEGQPEIISFLMICGDPTGNMTQLLLVVGGLVLFFVFIRAIRIKRARRLAETSSCTA